MTLWNISLLPTRRSQRLEGGDCINLKSLLFSKCHGFNLKAPGLKVALAELDKKVYVADKRLSGFSVCGYRLKKLIKFRTIPM